MDDERKEERPLVTTFTPLATLMVVRPCISTTTSGLAVLIEMSGGILGSGAQAHAQSLAYLFKGSAAVNKPPRLKRAKCYCKSTECVNETCGPLEQYEYHL